MSGSRRYWQRAGGLEVAGARARCTSSVIGPGTSFDVTEISPSPPAAATGKASQSSPESTAKPSGRWRRISMICRRSPLASLMPAHVRMLGQRERRGGQQVDARCGRGRCRGRPGRVEASATARKWRAEPVLRGLVVVGRGGEDAVDAEGAHAPGLVHGAAGVVAGRAGHHRHPAGGGLDHRRDDLLALAVVHGLRLAGGAAGHEEVDAFGDLPLDERAERPKVERAVLGERRDQRGAAALEACHPPSPNSMSSTVCTPGCPGSHSAAASAPAAKPSRLRASCDSVTRSYGPSYATRCVPGVAPARTEVIGNGARRPPSVSARLQLARGARRRVELARRDAPPV